MSDADELLKKAGGFFSKLGGQLADASKSVGSQIKQTSKQVTGLGRGALELQLDQTRVTPGGTLAGRVVLALSEPVDAKRLVVTLRARQRYIAGRRGGDGKGVSATHAEVYQLDRELQPAQTFEPGGTHAFTLDVPPDALDLSAKPTSGSPIADVARTIASVVNPTLGPVEWQVIARLEIAWGRDLSREVDIVVAR